MRMNVLFGLVGLFISMALAGAGLFQTGVEAVTDPPELSVWLRNTTNATGYNNISSDVQQVRYSDNYVYVSSTGIPSYSIGPWPGNPNMASNQSYVFKIPRHPAENTAAKTSTPLGSIGVWKNGVVMFNALDAMSYQNQNIWHQNAVVVEAPSFDSCLGHPQQTGAYHHHQNPRCLYTANASQHSPLLGYAFDGFPIYGPYGYSNANGTGGIKRIASSYRLRNITQRHTLADGTNLSASQYGPNVSTQYPLGYYAEDYEYVSGLGDLDQYNGRFAVTPEYPNGTYAYFVTINADGTSAYPYIIGPSYYGVVATENITARGRVTVTESVTTYNPQTTPTPTPTPATATIQLSDANYSIGEAAVNTALGFTSLAVNVTRAGDTSAAATVQYFTSDQSGVNECNQVTGAASGRCDYATVAGTLRYAAGETSKTITIPIVNDGYVEGNEVFKITLQNPTGATLGTNSQANVTILDSGVATEAASNPYLSNSFFVRMNYLDFLGREPDVSGFTDWTNVLANCGAQQGWLGSPYDCDRAHVSHGFFGSPEFTDTGFMIYRLYEVGMGRLPRYAEFVPDMASLS
ncbi:MAG: YHYH protein, partial [Pyrinomonadaceae bacterium]|nr:YHYH protein [Pyrinomonadaceae bacterium]